MFPLVGLLVFSWAVRNLHIAFCEKFYAASCLSLWIWKHTPWFFFQSCHCSFLWLVGWVCSGVSPQWPLPGRWVGVSALSSPPLPRAREVEPAHLHSGWKPVAWVLSVVSLVVSERWSISCHISKQGCHSHQQFQPSKCEFLNSEGTWEEQCLQ